MSKEWEEVLNDPKLLEPQEGYTSVKMDFPKLDYTTLPTKEIANLNPEQYERFKQLVEKTLKEYQPTFHDILNKRDFIRRPKVEPIIGDLNSV